MTRAVIVDMDGTLDLGEGRVNVALAARLRALDAEGVKVIIVSARRRSRMAETAAFLNDNAIPYAVIYLNDFPPAAGQIPFKRYKAKVLLKEYEVIAAYENDAAVRAEYRKLGIPARKLA